MGKTKTKSIEKTCEKCGCKFNTIGHGVNRRYCFTCVPSGEITATVIKKYLVAQKGGKCQICGYDRSVAALHFHHRNPATKKFNISHEVGVEHWGALIEEVEKCDLLCANCHAETHEKEKKGK